MLDAQNERKKIITREGTGNTMRASYQAMNPFMTSAEADRMLRIAEERGVFRTYAEEALNDGIGESLPQRFDAAFNYNRSPPSSVFP